VAAISKASGVSTGSIYGRFEDKEAILNTLMDAYYRSRMEQFDALFSVEACGDFDLGQLVSYYTDLLLASFRQDGALILLADSQRMTNDMIARQVNELNHHVASCFAEVLCHHVAPKRQADVRAAAMLYHDMVCCLARIAIQPTGPVASGFTPDDPASRQRVIGMFLDHLRMIGLVSVA
jgi:AcrR family transcriptional regulator